MIMTSGNLSEEPQVTGNDEAAAKLKCIADSILFHDRGIARRLDDGVVLPTTLAPMVIRRARGQTPGTIALPGGLPDRQVVAYGGELKSAICLTKNGHAMLSHHLGDLDNTLAYEEFLKAQIDLADLMDHRPEIFAVDMHPEYRASRLGRERAETDGLQLIEVQHHHAHMAAALGAAGWEGGIAIGIILDGLGFGPDGTIWGGEVLVGGYQSVQRAGQLGYAPLPGGDRAQMEPWRNALMRLDAAGLADVANEMFPNMPRQELRKAANSGVNSPQSSSAGRLFDAVAACLGIVPKRQSFEGEAAMILEALATSAPKESGAYELANIDGVIDPNPMFQELVRDLDRGVSHAKIAARSHRAIATGFAQMARAAANKAGATTIALSGGCFQNRLLLEFVAAELQGFELCGPGPVPVNDGGLAFGQALVALAQAG